MGDCGTNVTSMRLYCRHFAFQQINGFQSSYCLQLMRAYIVHESNSLFCVLFCATWSQRQLNAMKRIEHWLDLIDEELATNRWVFGFNGVTRRCFHNQFSRILLNSHDQRGNLSQPSRNNVMCTLLKQGNREYFAFLFCVFILTLFFRSINIADKSTTWKSHSVSNRFYGIFHSIFFLSIYHRVFGLDFASNYVEIFGELRSPDNARIYAVKELLRRSRNHLEISTLPPSATDGVFHCFRFVYIIQDKLMRRISPREKNPIKSIFFCFHFFPCAVVVQSFELDGSVKAVRLLYFISTFVFLRFVASSLHRQWSVKRCKQIERLKFSRMKMKM